MMKLFNMKRWMMAGMVVVMALLSVPSVQAAVPASWKDTGFSINATDMKLRDVLNEFGVVYGVRVSIDIKDNRLLKGRLKADNGVEFLDRLTQAHKFRWFVYNETLYIVPRDDNASVRLQIGEDAVLDAKAALVGLGLFDTRFGWGELPDEGIVMISGPRAYVNFAREILLPDEKKVEMKGKQVMVFRLKYATATDRVINSRGKTETLPGIKTILSGLLLGPETNEKLDDVKGGSKFDPSSEKRSRLPKNGKGGAQEVGSALGLRGHGESTGDYGGGHSKGKHQEREERPRIEADPALNAIMIYDNVSKRDMYKALIADLDVEPQQIEIEALIVDIDRNKLADMGVEWGVRSPGGNVQGTVNGTNGASQGTNTPLPGSTLLITNAARFYARLRALEGSGEAQVLAKPTVLTLDNVAAVLDLSQTAYVQLIGERAVDLANVTAGTMLRVVPRIVQEGETSRVRLEVDIEDGALGDASLKSGVTRSTISTQAIIDMQQTLMIGGYHSESVSKNMQKVPVLGDVPLFGGLFRNNAESYSTRERLFLITPRMVGTKGVPAGHRSKTGKLARKYARADNPESENLPPANTPQPAIMERVAPLEGESPTPAATDSKAPDSAADGSTTTAKAFPSPSPSKMKESGMSLQMAKTLPSIEPAMPSALLVSSAASVPKLSSKIKCARPKGSWLM